MAWDSVDSSKATEKQIKYAETLLEACYGDINKPIYTMSKQDISVLIEETKKKLNKKGINYHSSTTEVPIGTEVEGNNTHNIGRGLVTTQMLFDEYAFGRVRGSLCPEHIPGSAIHALRYAEREATRRRTEIQRLTVKIEIEGEFRVVYDPMDFTSTIRLRWNSFCRNAVLTQQLIDDIPDAIQRTKKELIEVMTEDVYRDRLRQEAERSVYGAMRLDTRPLNPFYSTEEVEILRGEE